MLIDEITPDRIRAALTDPPRRLAPPVSDRGYWEGLDPDATATILAEAEALSSTEWQPTLASQYGRFRLDGNREEYERAYFGRRRRLVAATTAAMLTDEDRWLTDVVDGIWLVCDEFSWTVPAHATRAHQRLDPLADPADLDLDLFCAETGALLSWIDHLLGERLDAFSPTVRRRLRARVCERVLEPFRTRRDWRWLSGFVNNWNPWIHSNVLTAALLVGDQSQRCSTAELTVRGLDVFLDSYHDDGGCDEGASYWGRAAGSLIDNLGLLDEATGGALDGFDHPKVRPMAEFLPAMHLSGRWYVNFADCPAQIVDRSVASPLLRAGERFGSAPLLGLATEIIGQQLPWFDRITSLGRVIHLLTADVPPASATAAERHRRPDRAWYPDTQVLAARAAGSGGQQITLAAKGGHNAESHNHNDVGSWIVAVDGLPVVIDLGVGVYTKQTFSPDRYQIFTMQSDYHNLPNINGQQQSPGREFAAQQMEVDADGDRLRCALDIAGAYPAAAGVRQWLRTLTLDRDTGSVTQTDHWQFDGDSGTARWQLMLAAAPTLTATGATLHRGADEIAGIVAEGVGDLDLGIEEIDLDDAKLHAVWGDRVHRLLISPRDALPRSGAMTITFRPSP